MAEVQKATSASPPRDAAEILKLTLAEIEQDFTEPLCSAQELDTRFAAGNWRPIYRFLIVQGDKSRLIDDGRRGGQNSWSSMSETIYTISLDMVPAIAHRLAQSALRMYGHQTDPTNHTNPTTSPTLPDWFHLELGTDDLPDAFRGCPIHPDQQRAAVVAVWNEESASLHSRSR